MSETSWGETFSVISEVDVEDKTDETNLRVAYFHRRGASRPQGYEAEHRGDG